MNDYTKSNNLGGGASYDPTLGPTNPAPAPSRVEGPAAAEWLCFPSSVTSIVVYHSDGGVDTFHRPPTVTLELNDAQARVLAELFGRIGGSPAGRRGRADEIQDMLAAAGYTWTEDENIKGSILIDLAFQVGLRVKEIEHGLTLAKPTEGYVRTAGLHASDLYGGFYKDHDPKRYDKRDAQGNATPMDMTKVEMGTSFEEVLEPALRQRLFGERPGEFTSPEGIIYSPDYLFIEDDGSLVLGEFKLTWYSSRGAPFDPKFAKWWTQIKMYCHWQEITRARLFVLFVNGDYCPPTPSLRAWEAVFTRQELQDEFNVIARHARKKGTLKSE